MKSQIKNITAVADLAPAMKELRALSTSKWKAYERFQAKESERRAALDTKYAPTDARIAELERMIQDYADKHRKEVFADGQTYDVPDGQISLRFGKLVVELKKGTTIHAVAAMAKKLKLAIIRQPDPQLDKVAAAKLDEKTMKQLGLVASKSVTIGIKLFDA